MEFGAEEEAKAAPQATLADKAPRLLWSEQDYLAVK